MGAADTAEVERRIAECLERADHAGAATFAIRGFGPQILGYLSAIVRDETDAADVFSSFCEDLWRGIAEFRRESSFKTWAYRLAWHAASRLLRHPHRRRSRSLRTEEAEQLAVEVRSTTALHLKEHAKDALAAMREALEPDEQTLLILRIDRGLSWREIASILDDETGARAEAAKRKRFERLKEKLRLEAIARGLLREKP